MYCSIYYINLDQFKKSEYSKGLIIRISDHMCSDTTFLNGQNPYNTL